MLEEINNIVLVVEEIWIILLVIEEMKSIVLVVEEIWRIALLNEEIKIKVHYINC